MAGDEMTFAELIKTLEWDVEHGVYFEISSREGAVLLKGIRDLQRAVADDGK
jgi:hypothetical protein